VAVEQDEWMTREVRYDLRWHTFFRSGAISGPDLLNKERSRTTLLKRKLVDEIRGGSRIFVVKSRDTPHASPHFPAQSAAQQKNQVGYSGFLNRIPAAWMDS
jgi:hypothetical protein